MRNHNDDTTYFTGKSLYIILISFFFIEEKYNLQFIKMTFMSMGPDLSV